MKKVCLFDAPPMENFHGYRVETFDPIGYFPRGSHWPLREFIASGLNGYNHRRALVGAGGVDRLYRERNPHYMRMVADFVERFRDFDLIVMGAYNFIHPDVLVHELKKPTKVLGFIDDPYSTYTRGIPYLWAFDGAFFISPGYSGGQTFNEAMQGWTRKPSIWHPLTAPFSRPLNEDDTFFRQRDVDLVYVGNAYDAKLDRLVKLKRHFGNRLRVHGRWRFNGYYGILRGLLGKPVFPHRVTSLAPGERTDLYWRTKIGFNMHLSDYPSESGNMRMYETPAHGMLMVCDKAAADSHARIFEPGVEAVYYDDLPDAVGLIEYYLENDDERIRIAMAGYERFWREYEWESNTKNLLDWACALRTQ